LYGQECSFIEPSEEFTFYQAGKLTELRESADETFTLANVHHLMMGERHDQRPSLLRQVDKVEEVKPTNFLELLHMSNSLS
jgi:hypothetical protein